MHLKLVFGTQGNCQPHRRQAAQVRKGKGQGAGAAGEGPSRGGGHGGSCHAGGGNRGGRFQRGARGRRPGAAAATCRKRCATSLCFPLSLAQARKKKGALRLACVAGNDLLRRTTLPSRESQGSRYGVLIDDAAMQFAGTADAQAGSGAPLPPADDELDEDELLAMMRMVPGAQLAASHLHRTCCCRKTDTVAPDVTGQTQPCCVSISVYRNCRPKSGWLMQRTTHSLPFADSELHSSCC